MTLHFLHDGIISLHTHDKEADLLMMGWKIAYSMGTTLVRESGVLWKSKDVISSTENYDQEKGLFAVKLPALHEKCYRSKSER